MNPGGFAGGFAGLPRPDERVLALTGYELRNLIREIATREGIVRWPVALCGSVRVWVVLP